MPPRGGVLAASEPGELGSNKSGPGVGNGKSGLPLKKLGLPLGGAQKFPKLERGSPGSPWRSPGSAEGEPEPDFG